MLPSEIFTSLQYVAPPVVGSFIGYVTNKIAIKMLFRPLNPWYIFGMRVPMTPGVIPSKRHQLAENMGKMIAEYLITGPEVQKIIAQPQVQEQLQKRISDWGEGIADKDLGTVKDLVPAQYSWYYDHAVAYLSSKSKNALVDYTTSENFASHLQSFIDVVISNFLKEKISDIISSQEKEDLLASLGEGVSLQVGDFLAGDKCQELVGKVLDSKVQKVFAENKTLGELLPSASKGLIADLVKGQIPSLLSGFDVLVKDETIRERVVAGGCGGVENFIASMGPMAAMVSNFVEMSVVKEKLNDYLNDKEEDIIAWIHGPEMAQKLETVLFQQLNLFYAKPVTEIVKDPENVEAMCATLTEQIASQLASDNVKDLLSSTLVEAANSFIEEGATAGDLLNKLIGEQDASKLGSIISKKCVESIDKDSVDGIVSNGVDHFFEKIEGHKIGKLSKLLNPIMRTGIYQSSQKFLNKSLADAIPGMVGSFKLQEIISEKIDSLDLLKLEALLLSIMEEQFKYINLFGAFLGFILGCFNLLFLLVN